MKKRIVPVLLTLCLLLTILPQPASALSMEAVYVSSSLHLNFDRYAIISYGGENLRTDELTAAFNGQLWDKMSDGDRERLMRDYAVNFGNLKAQFGEAKANEMCDWVNDFTGWTDARESWKNRVMAKNYPALTAFFTDGEGREGVTQYYELPAASDSLPEAIEYRRLYKLFDDWYRVGIGSTAKLKTFKTQAVGIAAAATSGELVKLIMDNALMGRPPMSLADAVKDQVISYTDQIFGIKDSLLEAAIGDDMLTPEKAADMIGKLNDAIRIQERLANYAMTQCNSLKDRLDDAKEKLAKANADYVAAGNTAEDELKTAADTLINGDVTAIPPEIDPEQVYRDVCTAYNAAIASYSRWESAVKTEKGDKWDELERALEVYEWPADVDMNTIPLQDPAVLMQTMEEFFDFSDRVENSVRDAKSCCNSNIAAWESYETACVSLLSGKTAAFKEVEAVLQGVYSCILSLPEDEHLSDYQNMLLSINATIKGGKALLDEVAAMQQHSPDGAAEEARFSGGIDSAIDEQTRQYSLLDKNLTEWQGKTTDALAQAKQQRDLYAEAMWQLIENDTGTANCYLKNLRGKMPLLKSTDEILSAYGSDDMARIVNMSPPDEVEFMKLNIMMRDLYGYGYDYLRLQAIISKFAAERADIMRMSDDDFTARTTHYKNMAYCTTSSANPNYQATPVDMARVRSFSWNRVTDLYYANFWDGEDDLPGVGVLRDMCEKRRAGYIPAEGLQGLGSPLNMRLASSGGAYDLSLSAGDAYDLAEQIYVLPRDATEQDIIWSSSDYRVARVDENGVVTGVSDGLATITARAYDTPSTNNEAFTKTVVFKVGGGTPEPGWHIEAPEITADEAAGTVSAKASLSFVGEGGEDLYCILALYQSGRMLALSTCRADFDLLPDGSVRELTVSCALPAGTSGGLSAKLFRIDSGSLAPQYEVVAD